VASVMFVPGSNRMPIPSRLQTLSQVRTDHGPSHQDFSFQLSTFCFDPQVSSLLPTAYRPPPTGLRPLASDLCPLPDRSPPPPPPLGSVTLAVAHCGAFPRFDSHRHQFRIGVRLLLHDHPIEHHLLAHIPVGDLLDALRPH